MWTSKANLRRIRNSSAKTKIGAPIAFFVYYIYNASKIPLFNA